jgi:probable O-glycosylation ligase (exosortase A-associated)
MLSYLFGLLIFFCGIFGIFFFDAFWGIVAAACFVHITPMQLHIEAFRPALVLSLLTLCFYIAGQKYKTKFNFKPVEFWMMSIMLLGLIFGLMNAYDKKATWEDITIFFKITVFFLLMINLIDDRRKLKWFIDVMLLSAAWLVYRCWDLRGTTGARFENIDGGIIQDSNQYAAALLLLLPLAIGRAMQKSQNLWIRLGAAVGAFGIIMSIIITVSRGAFLGLIASGCAFFYFYTEHRKRMLALIIVLFFVITPFVPEFYRDRTAAIFSSENVSSDASATSRMTSWSLALELWQEHPFFGIGGSNFGYYMGYRKEDKQWGERGHVAHSVWFQALSEGGIFVTLPFLAMIGIFFYKTQKTKSMCLKSDISINISSLQVGMIGFLVSATFVNRLFYEPIYWWCGLAAIHMRLITSTKSIKDI